MSSKSNFLLISGSGQNCGKTSLAETIVKSKDLVISYIKISPHFHELAEKTTILFENSEFRISREYNYTSNKDTSRLLRAGCKEVFYIQSNDKNLNSAIKKLGNYTDIGKAIIVESGALINVIKPGLFIFVEKEPIPEEKKFLKKLADIHTEFYNITFITNRIQFQQDHWVYAP